MDDGAHHTGILGRDPATGLAHLSQRSPLQNHYAKCPPQSDFSATNRGAVSLAKCLDDELADVRAVGNDNRNCRAAYGRLPYSLGSLITGRSCSEPGSVADVAVGDVYR